MDMLLPGAGSEELPFQEGALFSPPRGADWIERGNQADTKSQGVYPIKAAVFSILDVWGIVNFNLFFFPLARRFGEVY